MMDINAMPKELLTKRELEDRYRAIDLAAWFVREEVEKAGSEKKVPILKVKLNPDAMQEAN